MAKARFEDGIGAPLAVVSGRSDSPNGMVRTHELIAIMNDTGFGYRVLNKDAEERNIEPGIFVGNTYYKWEMLFGTNAGSGRVCLLDDLRRARNKQVTGALDDYIKDLARD